MFSYGAIKLPLFLLLLIQHIRSTYKFCEGFYRKCYAMGNIFKDTALVWTHTYHENHFQLRTVDGWGEKKLTLSFQ